MSIDCFRTVDMIFGLSDIIASVIAKRQHHRSATSQQMRNNQHGQRCIILKLIAGSRDTLSIRGPIPEIRIFQAVTLCRKKLRHMRSSYKRQCIPCTPHHRNHLPHSHHVARLAAHPFRCLLSGFSNCTESNLFKNSLWIWFVML
jgi:hypothetical protein